VACYVGGGGHSFSFAGWRKPALHTPTFHARRCSAMKREPDDVLADKVQREKFAKAACNGKRAVRKNSPRHAIQRESATLNLRLRQPFLKINRG
jgi:hypothetical protein